MAGLVIGAVSLETQSFQELTPRERGSVSASFNNKLRSSISSSFREFQATTSPITTAQRDSLNAAIANSTPVNVSGDNLGAAVIQCIVTATYALFPGTAADSLLYIASLSIRATGN